MRDALPELLPRYAALFADAARRGDADLVPPALAVLEALGRFVRGKDRVATRSPPSELYPHSLSAMIAPTLFEKRFVVRTALRIPQVLREGPDDV